MNIIEWTAQSFGIIGLIFCVLSYQEKDNGKYLVKQGLAGFLFFLNFILIGAVAASLFNLTNLLRGVLFSKKERKPIFLILVTVLYIICFAISLFIIKCDLKQILLSSFTFITLVLMTFLMWGGNGKYIRYGQLFASSPSWLVHNIFNFSLGGILGELFTMCSVIVSFIRFGKDLEK